VKKSVFSVIVVNLAIIAAGFGVLISHSNATAILSEYGDNLAATQESQITAAGNAAALDAELTALLPLAKQSAELIYSYQALTVDLNELTATKISTANELEEARAAHLEELTHLTTRATELTVQRDRLLEHHRTLPFQRATVTRVVDGNILEVRLTGGGTDLVRLIGVRMPRRADNFDSAVAFINQEIQRTSGVIWLQTSGHDRDDEGRLHRYVWLDIPAGNGRHQRSELQLNRRLIDHGHAR
jgi:endonuclease YncB( thermonuclease family)